MDYKPRKLGKGIMELFSSVEHTGKICSNEGCNNEIINVNGSKLNVCCMCDTKRAWRIDDCNRTTQSIKIYEGIDAKKEEIRQKNEEKRLSIFKGEK